MKLFRILSIAIIALLVCSAAAMASDFGWTRDFNKQAKADWPGFRAKMATRFDLRDMQVIALRNIFASPADAYIMLRFGEMKGVLKKLSKEEGIEAVKKYRANKQKGWLVLAGILGVETESDEFLALRSGHDLYDDNNHDQQVAYNNGYGRNKVN
jgi:hypothetical protein